MLLLNIRTPGMKNRNEARVYNCQVSSQLPLLIHIDCDALLIK